jgi:hypothetical protein
MNLAYLLSGGAPVLKRHKIGASAAAGIPVTETSGAGIANATTTAITDAVGVTVDASTYTTTQATDMVEGVATVIINPDAVLRAKMVSAATGNTQLNLTTNSAANTAGTTITITTGDAAPNSPEMSGGTAFCVSGNNKGLSRVITSTAATTATLTVPFPHTIAAGDTFVLIPWSVPGVSNVTTTLTTDLTAVRGDQAASSTALINVVDLEIDSELPRSNSYLHLLLQDHMYGQTT